MFTKHNLFFHKKLLPLKTNLFSRYHHSSKEPGNGSGVSIIVSVAIISSLSSLYIIFKDPPPRDY